MTYPSELVNSITEQKLLFKGGNCLDIQLAADAAADPKRKSPVSGDVCILVTQQAGKPYAVIFRPIVAGFAGDYGYKSHASCLLNEQRLLVQRA